jgi:hypothetical protein
MLTNLGRQFRSWFRSTPTGAPPRTPPVPPPLPPSTRRPEGPIPIELVIEVDSDVIFTQPDPAARERQEE